MIAIGSTVGNYEVIAKLGSGAMGSVFLAEHPRIGKRVALKVIHADLAANAEMVSRFFTEARAVTQIANDHIIDVQNFGQTPEGDNFIIMEFLDGASLGARLKREPFLQLDLAMHIAWQVADGLAASHSRGIIHRDLKPDNIFLVQRGEDPHFVKILDFGLAKLTANREFAGMAHKTQAGSVLGTPHYMAPEQCEGRPDIDHRVDIYALGCILYEMLCGRVPFPGEGFGEVLVKHLREPPTPPTVVNPDIPPAVEKIILHALAKKKEYRFATMDELRAAIGAPEAYLRAMEGERPAGANTLELLARSPVRIEHSGNGVQRPSLGSDTPTPEVFDTQATVVTDMPSPRPPPRASGDIPTSQPIPIPRQGGGGVWLLTALIVLAMGASGGAVWWFLIRPRTAELPVQVVSQPPGATVLRDGQPLGKTPVTVKLKRSAAPVDLVVSKDGYLDARRRVNPGEESVDVKLVPKPRDEDLLAVPKVKVDVTPPIKIKEETPTPVAIDPDARHEEHAETPARVEPKHPKPQPKRPHPAAEKPDKGKTKPTKPPLPHFDDDVLEPSF